MTRSDEARLAWLQRELAAYRGYPPASAAATEPFCRHTPALPPPDAAPPAVASATEVEPPLEPLPYGRFTRPGTSLPRGLSDLVLYGALADTVRALRRAGDSVWMRDGRYVVNGRRPTLSGDDLRARWARIQARGRT